MSFESSEEEEEFFCLKKKQRKLGPQLWKGVKVEQVDRIPDNIDGLSIYSVKITSSSSKTQSRMSAIEDGRQWKKDSGTQWTDVGDLRYSDCLGSDLCTNEQCNFKKEFGVVNQTQFDKKSKECSVCGVLGKYVPCPGRRYILAKKSSFRVYHCGKHTCPIRTVNRHPTEET